MFQSSDLLPHKGGKAREEGVETPVLCEVRNNDGPDRSAGQHGPPRGHQCCLHNHGYYSGEIIDPLLMPCLGRAYEGIMEEGRGQYERYSSQQVNK